MKKTFIFTCGDINGIGPELVVKTFNKICLKSKDKFLFICPKNVFINQIKKTEPAFEFEISSSQKYSSCIPVSVLDIGYYKQTYGKAARQSGLAAYNALLLSRKVSSNPLSFALITAPISKEAFALAGIKYHGHTEMLANWFGVKNFVMMFLSQRFNAALITIHQPIKNVSKLITPSLLKSKFDVILNSLKLDFNIPSPKIAVLGLNPHAGENGVIGDEELKVLKPFLKKYNHKKFFSGPVSSDGFFGMRSYLKYDMVVGMYHDQILNPFKLLNFNRGVNYTAGMPIVRTSPDHGTAFDIAGKEIADETSMLEAYKYAKRILQNRNAHA